MAKNTCTPRREASSYLLIWMLMTASGEAVIDYKSGERNDKRYLRQLARYIAKLRLIFPGTPIAGRLWYVTHDLILDEKGVSL